MTCIAVLNQDGYLYMAGERAVSNEDVLHHLSTPKIWKWGEYMFGYAGHMSGLTVYNSFMPPQPNGLRGKSLDKFMNTVFLEYTIAFYEEHSIRTDNLDLLIAVGDRIYEHSTDNMSLYTYAEPYNSIGSGSPYAMGSFFSTADFSLSGEQRIKMALKAATTFSPSCSGKIDIIKNKI
jgi:ATP-dependent protease HslVU (ClpYQ) peptidase subunit